MATASPQHRTRSSSLWRCSLGAGLLGEGRAVSGRHRARPRSTVRRNFREMPRAAWFLIVGQFINWFASFAIVFLVLFLTKKGFGVGRAGAALAVYGLGELSAGVVGGHMADRLGRRTTIALAMFGRAASVLALYFAQAYALVLLPALLAGVCAEAFRPA